MNNKISLVFVALMSLSLSVFAARWQPIPFDPASVSIVDASLAYSQDNGSPVVTTIGTIKNSSESLIEDIVVEVKYFDGEKKLIDVITQPIYGLVVPASQEVAFRVRDVADKPKAAYVSNSVRVVSAEQRPQSKQSSFSWPEILISWAPMLLLIAVWIFFTHKFNKKGSPNARTIELIENQNAILERLATAAEKAILDK